MTLSRLFLIFNVALIAVASTARAKDIYVGQTSAGSDSGADCSNTHSIGWANTAGNWGAGGSQISPGDTVHLCGTFTSTLAPPGSGTSGNPVTFLFESGAKFSKAAWGTGASAAIWINTQSYLTIDGGTNGLIECTDNGTALGQQVDADGIDSQFASAMDAHLTVKNLKVWKLYQRTSGSTTDHSRHSNGISLVGSYNTIQNNTCSDADTCIAN